MLNLDTTQLQKLSFNQYLTQGVATGQKNHFDQLPIGHNLLYVFGQHKHTAKKIPTCEEILRSELFSTRLSNLSPLASTLSMVLCCKYQNQEHKLKFCKRRK
jgi:hypothetical protein